MGGYFKRKTSLAKLCESYDRIAGEYARRSFTELTHKPADCHILDTFADRVTGRVCDLGCGPGQVARYLRDRGVDVVGMDVSPGMLKEARRLNPDIDFFLGDMRVLPVGDEAWGGIAAFYSIVHVPRRDVPAVLKEWHRVLAPSGQLLLTFHLGNTQHRSNDCWGLPVELDYTSFVPDEMQDYLTKAGFSIEGWLYRPPYVTPTYYESPSYRGYLVAQKTAKHPEQPILSTEIIT